MSAAVSFANIARMLADCANGHTLRMATHSRVVSFNGRVYRSLPKFDKIELGHIRKMVRHLEIDRDCASRHLPQL
jgi:hypothetical protein